MRTIKHLLLYVMVSALVFVVFLPLYISHGASTYSHGAATMSGAFMVVNPARDVTVELRHGSATGNLITTATVPVTQSGLAYFVFNDVAPGTYSLVFHQLGHTSFTFNDVVMTSGVNLNLTHISNFPELLPLHAGNVSGSGQVNISDLGILLQHWMGNYANANFTGSGQINISDLNLLLQNWMAQSTTASARPMPIPPTPVPPMPTPIPPTPAPPLPTPIPSTPIPVTPQPTPNLPTPTPHPPGSPTPVPLTTIPNRRLTIDELSRWRHTYSTRGGANTFETELLRLINAERTRIGVTPLLPNNSLMMAARFKAQSMRDLGYFGFENPVYGSFPAIPEELFGFSFLTGSEHISRWHPTAQAVFDAWMSAPDQRDNLLDSRFIYTGIGVINTGTGTASLNNLWVQMFTGHQTNVNPPHIPEPTIVIPNRRLTAAEINAWITEYNYLGTANEFELEIVRLTNIERAHAGLQPVTINNSIMMAARFKAQSMAHLDYIDHEHPVYGNFANAPRELFNVRVISENLAMSQPTPQEVVSAFMNSEVHRVNILNPRATEMGAGFFRGRWVQLFG